MILVWCGIESYWIGVQLAIDRGIEICNDFFVKILLSAVPLS